MPAIAVLSTGDEVVEPATLHLEPGQIRDANRAMLVAACKQAGAQVMDLGIARDTEGHVEACLQKAIAARVDVLVTTGETKNNIQHSQAVFCGEAQSFDHSKG